MILDNGSTLVPVKPHLMYGVEEAPIKVGERHRHVPRVDAEETRRPLCQFHAVCQGRLKSNETFFLIMSERHISAAKYLYMFSFISLINSN